VLLCQSKNEKPTPVLKKLNLSPGNLEKWKNGATVNSDILEKIAIYFGVTTDQLLGRAPLPDENIGKEVKYVTNGNHEQRYSMKHYMCSCGKSEHYADALYCANCGKKIEEAVSSTPSAENHL